MQSPTVRCDYEALGTAAQAFSQQADVCQRSLDQLLAGLEVLRGGDWLGKGANAFYQEMDAQVLPSVRRLVQALQQGSAITRQIGQTMKQAEEEAARYLRANGNGAGVGAGAAGGTGASAFIPADPNDAAGAGSSMPTGGAGPAPSMTAMPGPRPAARPSWKFLKSFGDDVYPVLEESPTMLAQLSALEKQGYQVLFHTGPEPTSIDAAHKEVKIRMSNSTGVFLDLGAALGRFQAPAQHLIVATPTAGQPKMTRDEFMMLNVNQMMLEPASEMLNQEIVKAEFNASVGNQFMKPPGGYSADEVQQMNRVREQFVNSRINRDQAMQQMADVFGNHTEPGAKVSNWEWRAKILRDYWDQHAKEYGWE